MHIFGTPFCYVSVAGSLAHQYGSSARHHTAVKPFHQVGRHHDSYVAVTQLMKHRHCKVLRRATVGAVPNATAESFKL